EINVFIQGTKTQWQAQKQTVRIQTHFLHEPQGVVVRAQQDMLSVVRSDIQALRVLASCATAQYVTGLEDMNLTAQSIQRPGSTRAGPAAPDDSYFHRARRRTSPRPPLTQVFQASQNLRMGVRETRCSSTCQLSRSISSSKAK